MSKITFVIAGDKNFSHFVNTGIKYIEKLNYPVLIYDLGGLGKGIPFEGRYGSGIGAKIPCKPHIVKDALSRIPENEYVVWFDADALIFDRIDEIQEDYDVGVTVRVPKALENSNPINAGIIFFKNTPRARNFVQRWTDLADKDVSDQPPLNRLARVVCADLGKTLDRDGVRIKVYPSEIYNNVYFGKKDKPGIKIKHFKSKLRHLYPK